MRTLAIALLFIDCVGFTGPARAQERAETHNAQLEEDISTLKRDINVIASEQRNLSEQLRELKDLLAANAVARPTPQPPTPPSALTLHDETFRGQNSATVAIVEYADYECPYCGQYEHDVYPQVSRDYIQTGKIKYFFRDLPLPMHPRALGAARAARCAGEQGKYWEMHDSLFAKQNAIRDVDMPGHTQELGLDTTKISECLVSDRYTDEINKSIAEAEKMGIGGTPTFFIGKVDPNDEVTNLKMIMGWRPYEDYKSVIDGLLIAKN